MIILKTFFKTFFKKTQFPVFLITLLLLPLQLFAAQGGEHEPMDLTSSSIGYIALILFFIA